MSKDIQYLSIVHALFQGLLGVLKVPRAEANVTQK